MFGTEGLDLLSLASSPVGRSPRGGGGGSNSFSNINSSNTNVDQSDYVKTDDIPFDRSSQWEASQLQQQHQQHDYGESGGNYELGTLYSTVSTNFCADRWRCKIKLCENITHVLYCSDSLDYLSFTLFVLKCSN